MIPRKRYRFYKGELKDILNCIFSSRVGDGDHLELFERKFAQYIGVKYAITTCSGRNGMELLLDALQLEKGDEVLMPAYTLKDLVYLIKDKGLVPKIIDVEANSFNLDPHLLEKNITRKTKVVIATHIFGLPCNIQSILDIAKQYQLKVIEDCAHALGAEYNGRKVGSFGKAGFFSFEVAKPVNTFGGGMVTTDDYALYFSIKERIKSYPVDRSRLFSKILITYLEDLIIKSPLYFLLISFFKYESTTKMISRIYLLLHAQSRVKHSRFTNLQALIGLRQLERLAQRNKARIELANIYNKRLNANILCQKNSLDTKHIYYFYVVSLPQYVDIEQIRKQMVACGVDVGIRSEITDNSALIEARAEEFPVTSRIYNCAVQLPLYDEITEDEINRVCRIINSLLSPEQ